MTDEEAALTKEGAKLHRINPRAPHRTSCGRRIVGRTDADGELCGRCWR